MELSMRNGFIAACVAGATGVISSAVMSYLLGTQPVLIREPIAQGVGAILAWLTIWPWIRKHDSRLVRQFGFPGYVVWIIIGMAGITAVRLYYMTG